MIIQFTVENFLSFKEPATLSLAASALKEKQTRSDEIVFELEGTNLSLLKSAVIYGANASGKYRTDDPVFAQFFTVPVHPFRQVVFHVVVRDERHHFLSVHFFHPFF